MTPRKDNNNVYELEYYKGHPYTTEGKNLYEQCVWYVLGRVGEVLGFPMTYWESMPNCSSNPAWNYMGVRNAKEFLKNTRWEVSSTPKVGSVLVLDGYYGHVAFVEEDLGNGKYGISQYNKNSDRKFHYEEVTLTGIYCYGMKILGYLVLPIKEIERNKGIHQFKVKVDKLNIRVDHSTNSKAIRFAQNGELFNVLDEYDDGTYKWYKSNDGWLATKPEWIEDYPINNDIEKLKQENSDLREKLERYESFINDIYVESENVLRGK